MALRRRSLEGQQAYIDGFRAAAVQAVEWESADRSFSEFAEWAKATADLLDSLRSGAAE